jgi:hypothetical protein
MKKLIMMAVMLLTSKGSFAFDASSQTLAYTAAEIIVTSAVTIGSSQVSTLATQARKMEAKKILKDVQDYNQNGSLSIFLAEKVSLVKSLDITLSVDESIDVLIEASEIILSE